jgi:hypothetical protein
MIGPRARSATVRVMPREIMAKSYCGHIDMRAQAGAPGARRADTPEHVRANRGDG